MKKYHTQYEHTSSASAFVLIFTFAGIVTGIWWGYPAPLWMFLGAVGGGLFGWLASLIFSLVIAAAIFIVVALLAAVIYLFAFIANKVSVFRRKQKREW